MRKGVPSCITREKEVWVQGTTHTELGLTWVTTDLAGHQGPMYQPAAYYRQLQFLLGQIDDLTKAEPEDPSGSG